MRGQGGYRRGLAALALAGWVAGWPALGGEPAGGHHGRRGGYHGFGLKYHRGFGYGGAALGVPPDGGYPSYGGPGYPHPAPPLQRLGPIAPFAYFGGPGHPTPGHPNVYGGVGPLAVDPPVVRLADQPGPEAPGRHYGAYTGMIPYPESTFAPFATAAGGTDLAPGTGPIGPPPDVAPPTPTPMPPPPEARPSPFEPAPTMPRPPRGQGLGADLSPAGPDDEVAGLKVRNFLPGTPADLAGLRAGDVIRSADGVPVATPADLERTIERAGRGGLVRLRVRTVLDGEDREVDVRLP